MKKIISLFQRNYDGDRRVRDEVVPGAEWVMNGEGVATRKWDGTCVMIRDGKVYKRYEVYVSKGKVPPLNFEAATEVDKITGKQQGWVPIGDGSEDQWHREAVIGRDLSDGTYELLGPKVQGNPENIPTHIFFKHGASVLEDAPRTFEGIRKYIQEHNIEGIVWHHPDGRMVKIKGKDFGIKR